MTNKEYRFEIGDFFTCKIGQGVILKRNEYLLFRLSDKEKTTGEYYYHLPQRIVGMLPIDAEPCKNADDIYAVIYQSMLSVREAIAGQIHDGSAPGVVPMGTTIREAAFEEQPA
jgi:hypothetical protein